MDIGLCGDSAQAGFAKATVGNGAVPADDNGSCIGDKGRLNAPACFSVVCSAGGISSGDATSSEGVAMSVELVGALLDIELSSKGEVGVCEGRLKRMSVGSTGLLRLALVVNLAASAVVSATADWDDIDLPVDICARPAGLTSSARLRRFAVLEDDLDLTMYADTSDTPLRVLFILPPSPKLLLPSLRRR
jgi:hypothetical protein